MLASGMSQGGSVIVALLPGTFFMFVIFIGFHPSATNYFAGSIT